MVVLVSVGLRSRSLQERYCRFYRSVQDTGAPSCGWASGARMRIPRPTTRAGTLSSTPFGRAARSFGFGAHPAWRRRFGGARRPSRNAMGVHHTTTPAPARGPRGAPARAETSCTSAWPIRGLPPSLAARGGPARARGPRAPRARARRCGAARAPPAPTAGSGEKKGLALRAPTCVWSPPGSKSKCIGMEPTPQPNLAVMGK